MFRNYLSRTVCFDERSLALFRIAVGIMIIVDLVDRATVFEVMYTEAGLTPLRDLREIYDRDVLNFNHFSLHLLSGHTVFQAGMFVLAGLCAVGLILGWKTRLFTIICWLLHASIETRNPVYGSAADVTLGLMLFWGMFLPLGRTWSLDQKLGVGKQLRNKTTELVGGACYLAQIILIYLAAAWAKGPGWWQDGSALMYVLNWDMTVTDFGHAMTNYPNLLRAMSYFVYYLELIGILFILWPNWIVRGACVVLFVGLHAGIAATLDIGLFPYFSALVWIPLIPARFWMFVKATLNRSKSDSARENDGSADEESSRVAGAADSGSSQRPWIRMLPAALAIFTLLSLVLTTAPGVRRFRATGPGEILRTYLSFVKMTQTWSVFATERYLARDGWFVIQGTMSDGREVDIMRDLGPVDWSKPARSGKGRVRLSIIWLTYLTAQERRGGNLDQFAAYLNRKQQERSPDGEGFTEIRMYFMEESFFVPGEKQTVTKREFWAGPPP